MGDLDFSRQTIRIHAGKGGKDRVSILPDKLKEALVAHLSCLENEHKKELAMDMGEAKLPVALHRKLGTSSHRFYWQLQRIYLNPELISAPYSSYLDIRVKTTMIYTHVANNGFLGAISPLDDSNFSSIQ